MTTNTVTKAITCPSWCTTDHVSPDIVSGEPEAGHVGDLTFAEYVIGLSWDASGGSKLDVAGASELTSDEARGLAAALLEAANRLDTLA